MLRKRRSGVNLSNQSNGDMYRSKLTLGILLRKRLPWWPPQTLFYSFIILIRGILTMTQQRKQAYLRKGTAMFKRITDSSVQKCGLNKNLDPPQKIRSPHPYATFTTSRSC